MSDLAITSQMNMKNYSLIRSINLKMLVRFPKKIFTQKSFPSIVFGYTLTLASFPPLRQWLLPTLHILTGRKLEEDPVTERGVYHSS